MEFLLVLLLIQVRIPSNKENKNVKGQPWMENENGLFQTITISPLKEVWVQTMDVALHRQDTTYVGGGIFSVLGSFRKFPLPPLDS